MRNLWRLAFLVVGAVHAQEIGRPITPIENPVVTAYVNRLGDQLAAQFPAPQTYHLRTIREDIGGATHEPGVSSSGEIILPVDLISAARNESELAGMLAHAMAHIAEHHMRPFVSHDGLLQAVVSQTIRNTGNGWDGLPLPIALLTAWAAQERDADRLAVQAMSAAGYDPAGLASYLERLAPPPGDLSRPLDALPDRSERVSAIEAAVRQLPTRAYLQSDDFARAQAAVRK
jgi:beta-barrel assembly-enhancing protease